LQQWIIFQRLLKESFRDLTPIIFVILFFQLAILQTVPPGWEQTVFGLAIVGVGLAIFLYGLEVGIFPVGESLAKEFSAHKSKILVIFFGFLLGYGTTIAEPALSVIAEKAAAISSGRIDAYWLRQVVAASVGFAISLGVFRIIVGHPIHYYIISGYVAVVGMTSFTPIEIVGLSYDLGGITTSTVTVPLVAALGIGLASNIKGRNPVIDGFGLIAFASLFPMITVMGYGILTDRLNIKGDHELENELEKSISSEAKVAMHDIGINTVNIDGGTIRTDLDIQFSAVYTILPSDKVDDALNAAKNAGAGGVTIMKGHGAGLKELDNMYRMTTDTTDAILIFILPENIIHKVLNELNVKLHLSTTGSGIVYSMPIEHMRGISISQENIDEILDLRKNKK